MGKKPVKYSVVDAFTESPFKGNPAAVCLLEEERDDEWLQSVASEFNISETCYLTRIVDHDSDEIQCSSETATNPRYRLRWFTPVAEVKLCGHATLAAAHFLFTSVLLGANTIKFSTLSGVLTAKRVLEGLKSDSKNSQNGEAHESFFIELDFPVVPTATVEFNGTELQLISKALNGVSVTEIKKTTTGDDLLVVLPSGKAVADFQPQFDHIQNCPGMGLIITGLAPPESGFDFVSRFFCPKFGINEDPVCGSAHCALAPYWSKKLGKSDFVAYQVLLVLSFVISGILMWYITKVAKDSLDKALAENAETEDIIASLPSPHLSIVAEPYLDLHKPLIIKIDSSGEDHVK